MIKKIFMFGGIALGGISIGTGVSLAIVLPKAIKAKEGLGNFISSGGSYNSISGKEKINIVALGDSETAGYNALSGTVGRDYLSYTDFLAQSFKNAGKLGSYNNFAYSGLRLSDFGKYVFEDPSKVKILKNADEIFLTIGANDILALVDFLGIPFGQALSMISQGKSTSSKNIATIVDDSSDSTKSKIEVNLSDINLKNIRKSFASNPLGVDKSEDIFLLRNKIFKDSPELQFSKERSFKIFSNTLENFTKVLTGEGQYLINIEEDWYPKVFDLIKRSMSTLIRDLHKAAPNAQIQVLGHSFPFVQFSDKVNNGKKPELDNTTLKENFDRLLNSVKEGMEVSLGENNYATFRKIDEMKIDDKHSFKSLIKKVDFSTPDKFYESFLKNPMPNISDIHPSTYGHELIGKALFEILGKENGLSNSNIKKFAMKSFKPTTQDNSNTSFDETQWIRDDENETKIKNFESTAQIMNVLSNPGLSDNKLVGGIIKPIFKEMKTPSNKKISAGNFLWDIMSSNTLSKLKGYLPMLISDNIINAAFKNKISFNKKIDPIISDLDSNKDDFIDLVNKLVEHREDPALKQSLFLYPVLNLVGDLKKLLFETKLCLKQLKDNIEKDSVSRIEQYAISEFAISSLINNVLNLQPSIKQISPIFAMFSGSK